MSLNSDNHVDLIETSKTTEHQKENDMIENISLALEEEDEETLPFGTRTKRKLRKYFHVPNKKEIRYAWDWSTHSRGSPLWTEIKNNWKSGVTVSLVNVPLSISLAIAGGGDPVRGIATAFWAGLFSSVLGGSHYNIVGPTGALSSVLNDASFNYGADILPLLAIISGVMCLIIWVFSIDKYIMFIPSSVEQGFTVGVAILIAGSQFNSAFGLDRPGQGSFVKNMYDSFQHLGETNPYAFGLFFIQFIVLFFLVQKFPKIPWSIIITMIGILLGFLSNSELIPINISTLDNKYPGLELDLVKFPKFSTDQFNFAVISYSFTITFIAILETLISARIADSMTKTTHSQSREVFGVGVANIVTGVFGGMPATAALARTALNINNGATSRISGILNCVSVLVLSLIAFPLFKFIPMPTVAALLVIVAIRMVAFHHIKHMFLYDKVMFIVLILVALICIIEDTMYGILIGAVISLLLFADRMSSGHGELHYGKQKEIISQINLKKLDKAQTKQECTILFPQTEGSEDSIIYQINGQLSYINAIFHLNRIKKIMNASSPKVFIFAFRYLDHIDLDGVDQLLNAINVIEEKKGFVVLSGFNNRRVSDTLLKHKYFQEKLDQGYVYETHLDALKAVPTIISKISLSSSSSSSSSDSSLKVVVEVSLEN